MQQPVVCALREILLEARLIPREGVLAGYISQEEAEKGVLFESGDDDAGSCGGVFDCGGVDREVHCERGWCCMVVCCMLRDHGKGYSYERVHFVYVVQS